MAGTYQSYPNATAALIGIAVAFACAPATGQERPDDPPTRHADKKSEKDAAPAYAQARFALTIGSEEDTTAENTTAEDKRASPDNQLKTGPAALHGPTSKSDPNDTGALAAKNWLLDDWPMDSTSTETLLVGAAVVRRAATPHDGSADPITVRTSGQFGVEAAQLTPFTGGKQMFALELADGFTLAGVGSRRMWTERHRAFVLAAEAGWQLTPQAGLHLGYEVFQAPTGDVLPTDAGGDSIFARFQLRF